MYIEMLKATELLNVNNLFSFVVFFPHDLPKMYSYFLNLPNRQLVCILKYI